MSRSERAYGRRGRVGALAVLALLLLAGAAACRGLFAAGTADGELLWRVPLDSADGDANGAPATDGRRLYAIAGGIVAFDARDGRVLWRNRLPGETVQPRGVAVRGRRVFTAGAVAYALDARSGRQLWRVDLPDSSSAAFGAGVADGTRFYVGTDAHRVHALDQRTGRQRWSADVGAGWAHRGMVTGLALAGDTLYVTARQFNAENGHRSTGWIVGLDRRTGRELWRWRNGDGSSWRSVSAAPTVAGRLVLASDLLSGAVFAVDRFTGREVWRMVGPADTFGSLASPVVVNGTAYFASIDTWVYAVDAETGALRWKTRNRGGHFGLAVCGGRVFANFVSLAVLDRETGAVISRTPEGETFSELAVGHGRLFAFSDGSLRAYACHQPG